MNVSKSTLKSRLALLSIFASLAASSTAVCVAAVAGDAMQSTVSYADLNVSSSLGAATLFRRIRQAAEGVCRPLASRSLALQDLHSTCMHNAIASAVKDVDQPSLYAVFNSKSDAQQRLVLASSQSR